MVLGAVWCLRDRRQEITKRLREIKEKHGLAATFEVKWGKVSPAKVGFYQDWVDYFFDDDDLHFRAVIVPEKGKLRHEDFKQTHDAWYYKMYFTLLEVLLEPKGCYRIFIDRKDTHSSEKIAELHDVLCSSAYDFDRKIIEQVHAVVSHEVEAMQLCDLLTGAVGYANRKLTSSSAKSALVERMRKRSGYDLTRTTLLRERKVNLLCWAAAERPRE
jgi:hypothetical protein